MKLFNFNRHSSAFNQWLRSVLQKQPNTFKMTSCYLGTINATLESLRLQKKQFDDFVICKQREIDAMESDLIKRKMQGHFNYIKVQTYTHFSQLIYQYQLMLDGDNNY